MKLSIYFHTIITITFFSWAVVQGMEHQIPENYQFACGEHTFNVSSQAVACSLTLQVLINEACEKRILKQNTQDTQNSALAWAVKNEKRRRYVFLPETAQGNLPSIQLPEKLTKDTAELVFNTLEQVAPSLSSLTPQQKKENLASLLAEQILPDLSGKNQQQLDQVSVFLDYLHLGIKGIIKAPDNFNNPETHEIYLIQPGDDKSKDFAYAVVSPTVVQRLNVLKLYEDLLSQEQKTASQKALAIPVGPANLLCNNLPTILSVLSSQYSLDHLTEFAHYLFEIKNPTHRLTLIEQALTYFNWPDLKHTRMSQLSKYLIEDFVKKIDTINLSIEFNEQQLQLIQQEAAKIRQKNSHLSEQEAVDFTRKSTETVIKVKHLSEVIIDRWLETAATLACEDNPLKLVRTISLSGSFSQAPEKNWQFSRFDDGNNILYISCSYIFNNTPYVSLWALMPSNRSYLIQSYIHKPFDKTNNKFILYSTDNGRTFSTSLRPGDNVEYTFTNPLTAEAQGKKIFLRKAVEEACKGTVHVIYELDKKETIAVMDEWLTNGQQQWKLVSCTGGPMDHVLEQIIETPLGEIFDKEEQEKKES
jgi:hypothetical protein